MYAYKYVFKYRYTSVSYRLGEEGSCDRPNDGTILRGRRTTVSTCSLGLTYEKDSGARVRHHLNRFRT